MSSSWNGKSKGNVLGYKIFVYTIKYTGLGSAYFILRFVSLYYLLFSRKTFSYLFYYFRKRLHYGVIKSILCIYRNYYIFGQTLIDKIVVLSGFSNKFTYTFEGEENLHKIIKENKGGILISAHIGNWELAGHLLKDIEAKINIVIYEGEHVRIKEYLDGVMKKKDFKFIVVNEGSLNHIYEINNAIENKELICMHGDRFVKGSKTALCDFMGEKAMFPLGPFILASQLQIPVMFAFSMKETSNHYRFHVNETVVNQTNLNRQERDTEAIKILHSYIQFLEKILSIYPTQWFNYYQFWKTT